MHKFQKQGGYAANRRRIERKIGSAASDHACGVQATAGEGHRRSLCSPEAPLAEVGWGGQWAMKAPTFAQTFISGRKAGDGPKFAANFIQRRGHPNFEKNLSKLWPGPTWRVTRALEPEILYAIVLSVYIRP